MTSWFFEGLLGFLKSNWFFAVPCVFDGFCTSWILICLQGNPWPTGFSELFLGLKVVNECSWNSFVRMVNMFNKPFMDMGQKHGFSPLKTVEDKYLHIRWGKRMNFHQILQHRCDILRALNTQDWKLHHRSSVWNNCEEREGVFLESSTVTKMTADDMLVFTN